ncbi:large ribosomal subunit protein mL42 [Amyelois transitella]|uniref:large ribosomal subunit protein mL42 n=1 Tax=Amyelois transitella TaxID=680683 RepID=UPI0029904D62|nr:large ribosomal subunit protein mL42 [Amyelois transitella]
MSHLIRTTAFLPKNLIVRCYNKIVMTDDGSTIVALHREQEFPYEFSKPLPEEIKDDSILKMNDMKEIQRVFGNVKPEIAREQLSELTLTTKHRWFPRARDKRAKKNEMNRPYL